MISGGIKVHQFTQIRLSLEEKFGNTISILVLRSPCSLWTWTFFSSLHITFPQKSKYLFQIHKRGNRTRSVDCGSWSTVFNIDVQWYLLSGSIFLDVKLPLSQVENIFIFWDTYKESELRATTLTEIQYFRCDFLFCPLYRNFQIWEWPKIV